MTFLVKEIRSKDGELHFRRWALFDNAWFGVYLHHILKADEDKHPHNHPWSFIAIIIAGGYREGLITIGGWFNKISGKTCENKPCRFLYRNKDYYHKIHKLYGPTWTLVFRGPKRDNWGYLVLDDKDIPHHIDYKTYRENKRNGYYN